MRTLSQIESSFSDPALLAGVRRFFFVGIGGAGMSAVALLLHRQGLEVRGSDAASGGDAALAGLPVVLGHQEGVLGDAEAVVVSDAIDLESATEVLEARAMGLPLFRRSQVLGFLLRDLRVIAVTGTHGKTTTTAMIGVALAGLDPLVVVGAPVRDFNGPVRFGSGEWAVVEACEAYDALRDLDPHHVVVTNLEADHLDFHGSEESLFECVRRFCARASGTVFYCGRDSGAALVAPPGAVAYGDGELLKGMDLPGEHNRLNAEAARKVAHAVGAEDPDEALRGFQGAARRLEVLGDGPVTVIDDYAHMPAEIVATLAAVREKYPSRRVIAVFQPHLYSRTAEHWASFADALASADEVVVTDIYPAREAPMPGVSSARIAERIGGHCHYVPQRRLLPRFVRKLVKDGDVLVAMGAGDISDFGREFLDESPTRVAVVYGGDSAEREVSLHTGRAIHAALLRLGFDAFLVDVSDLLLGGTSIAQFAGPRRPACAFLGVHGNRAEDGAIQGFFELLHIPYTGSDIQSSAVAMDKQLTKTILSMAGLPFPKGALIRSTDTIDLTRLPVGPWVVKPNAQGSTVGLSFVEEETELIAAIEKARHYGGDVLVEEWVRGVEISVPVLAGQALPAVEIVPLQGSYDFANKYTPGATDEICPARLSPDLTSRVQELAVKAHQILGCRGATRTDMLVRDGEPVILEVNTLPGMTPTSLLPRSAGVAGIAFDELCRRILDDVPSQITA